MTIRVHVGEPADIEAAWLCAGVFEERPAPPPWLEQGPGARLIERLGESKDLPGGLGDATALHGLDCLKAGSLLLVGLGRREAFGAGPAFDAGVLIGKRLGGRPRESVAVVLPEAADPSAVASNLVQGVLVGTSGPGLAKSEPSRHAFGDLLLVVPPAADAEPAAIERAAAEGEAIGRAVNLARELVNLPPGRKPPRLLAERVRAEAGAAGLGVEVWDEPRIRRERLGGLLGVAAGSDEPPAFVTLEWNGAGPRDPAIALVGKGVTFDSGGLSLKPSSSMEDMKGDMTGAAAVAAAMPAVARLGLPVNLRGYLPLTENMTGGRAMKLGDVLTIRNGKTVEVMNTDAEGRLILADALSLAAEQPAGPDRRPGDPDRLVHGRARPEGRRPLQQRRPDGRRRRRRGLGRRRAGLAAAAGRRLPRGPQEPGRRPQERRRQVGRRDHRRQVPRGVRRRGPLGPPRHRRPGLGRRRLLDPRRRRHRLLRPDPRPDGRRRGGRLIRSGPIGRASAARPR